MQSYDIIQHHGVKGMRWGVRKARNYIKKIQTAPYNPSNTNPKTNTGSYMKRKYQMGTVKKARKMSDDELRSKTERLRLENELKKLSKDLRDHKTKVTYINRNRYTNSELKKINSRLSLERNFKRALPSNKIISTLSKFRMDIIKDYIKD